MRLIWVLLCRTTYFQYIHLPVCHLLVPVYWVCLCCLYQQYITYLYHVTKYFLIITQLSIYREIVNFLLSHESLNYCLGNSFGYWMGLYNGLVSRFTVRNTEVLFTCTTAMHVQFVYACRLYATTAEYKYDLATLNSNNFLVYRQAHKVWVLIFLV